MILFFVVNLLNAQTNKVSLKVIDVSELGGKVFEIKALKKSGDTIRILSIKETIDNKCLYEKIQKGTNYQFELRSKPLYIDNLTIRVGDEVYWKVGDDPKEMPYFANNIKNDFIEKD
ncbi:hypothetical protein KRX57_02460 [Weeksellaceae bacterium TAE3-ERU29]|nr:hypothetical protein [Weeksellaceae bacterium TAE3-ERU29]